MERWSLRRSVGPIALTVAACTSSTPAAPQDEPVPRAAPEPTPEPSTPAAVDEPEPAQTPAAPTSMTWYTAQTLRRSDDHASKNEKSVLVPAFEIDDRPVMLAEFALCEAAGACPHPRVDTCAPPEDPSSPITCIDMYEASAYCAWQGKQLPNEDQAERAKATMKVSARTMTEWLWSSRCAPWHRECIHADWTVDGMRERIVAARSDGGYIRSPELREPDHGFRCVRPAVVGEVPKPHPGPCWASCEGCQDDGDLGVDLRHVARWARGKLVDLIEMGETPTSKLTELRSTWPDAMLAAIDPTHVVVRDPAGRVIAANVVGIPGRHYFTWDAAGNLEFRSTITDEAVQRWQYHYACWDPKAPRKPHPDAVACPAAANPVLAPNAEFGRCVAGPKGGWDLHFENVEKTECEDPDSEYECGGVIVGDWGLRYTTRTGTVIEGPREEFTLDYIEVLERVPLAAFDYDGDGHEELVVRELTGPWEDAGPVISVWTRKDGAIAPYAPAEGIAEILDVRRIDRDRRPDLLAPGGLAIAPSYIMGDDCDGGVTSVYRSNPDGTFAVNAPATRRHLAKQCRRVAKSLLHGSRGLDGRIFGRLACSYLGGASREELRARIAEELPRARCTDDHFCACTRENYETFVDRLPAAAQGLLADKP